MLSVCQCDCRFNTFPAVYQRSRTEGRFSFTRNCVAISEVFWRVKKCDANQSYMVSVSVHSFCMRFEKSVASEEYHSSWYALKLPRISELCFASNEWKSCATAV